MPLFPADAFKWPRLFLSAEIKENEAPFITPEQAHYLEHVLRLKTGDSLRVFDGKTGEWQAFVEASGQGKKKSILLKLVDKIREQAPSPSLCLACAPIKKNHFDLILSKAVELGVSDIQPVLTERTQIREVNQERGQSLLIEAAEQCERLTVPKLHPSITLHDYLKNMKNNELVLFCAESGEARPLAEALNNLSEQEVKKSPSILVGPEGGFTPAEMAQIRALPHTIAVRMGPRILRADTAALAALACWQAIQGDWRDVTMDLR